MSKLKLLIHIVVVTFCASLLTACNNEAEESVPTDFSEVQGKPIEFDFKGPADDFGMTRATALPTSNVTVWVTADVGEHWYPYVWDSSNSLWKPKSTAITWTQRTMTLYAAVRYDITGDTWSDTFTLSADQSSVANFNKGDFLGARLHTTYTSGRVSMTLQHRVAKLVVLAQVNAADNKANLLTCQTNTSSVSLNGDAAVAGTAIYPRTGTISCGGNNVELVANVEKTIKDSDGNVTETQFPKTDTNYYDVFKLYKDNSITATTIDNVSNLVDNQTAAFAAYFIDSGGKLQPGLKFSYNKGGTTYYLTPTMALEQGGIGAESGRISCITILLPALPS